MTAPAVSLAGEARLLPGILLALTGALFFTVMDTFVKITSERLPTPVILFFVFMISALVPLSWCAASRRLQALRSRKPWVQLIRGIAMLLGSTFFFYALSVMSLADAYALLFTQPLLITVLSIPMLGERVGWRRWAAVAVGFVGVLIMLRPGAGLIEPAAIAVLGCSLLWGFGFLIVRKYGAVETGESFVVFGNLIVALGIAPLAIWFWVQPSGIEWLYLVLAGLLAGVATLTLTTAYRRAPAAVVAPFQYTQLPIGMVIGFFVFGDLPETAVLVGAGIIIASGLYILHRETRVERAV